MFPEIHLMVSTQANYFSYIYMYAGLLFVADLRYIPVQKSKGNAMQPTISILLYVYNFKVESVFKPKSI